MPITLDYLGELVRQMQADMRTIRSEVSSLREEVGTLRAEPHTMVAAISDVLRASEARLADRIARFEAHVDTRLDRMAGGAP